MEFRVLKFEASWCGPCRRLEDEFAKCRETVDVERIDVEQNPDLARKHNVRGVPTVIAVLGETELARLSGRITAAQIDQVIRQIREGLPPTLR